MADDDTSVFFAIEKAAPDGSFVRGWGAVTQNEDGTPATDWDGERMPMSVIRKSAHDFMCESRVGDEMHDFTPKAEVVESVIVDDDFAKAMGLTTKKRGWWVGMRVNDPSTREAVRKGKLRGFSVGGMGAFEPVQEGTDYAS